MKHLLKISLIFSFFLLFILVIPALAADNSTASDKINLYFFYGDGCPHCAKEEKFLDKLEKENDDIVIYRYEVWRNRENADTLRQIGKKLGIEIQGVPALIISDQVITGYYNDAVTGKKISELIEKYRVEECSDIVASLTRPASEDGACMHECDGGNSECAHDCGCSADNNISGTDAPKTVHIPLLGEISVKGFSLPLLTLIIAGTDGFNPCAMWVLLFLISLLLGVENRTRMWVLGAAFIIASGAVYFLFLAAWLNLFLYLGFVFWIRAAIGLTALATGVYHIRDFIKNPDGTCKVTGNEKRQRIFGELKKIVTEQKLFMALFGVVLLAVAVNLVELVCSAGLPAVYTQVLTLADLPRWQYYGYLLFYIFIFMLDDLFVFFIAMTTLKMKAARSWLTRYAGLVGGIVMFILGLLLLFKPGWVMFG